MKLIVHSPFPTGEFPYEQVFKGKTYQWAGEGLSIEQQTSRVLQFRIANGLPRATFSETLEDIDVFTCARLGNDPRFCSDGTRSSKIVQQVKSGGCKGCGARLT